MIKQQIVDKHHNFHLALQLEILGAFLVAVVLCLAIYFLCIEAFLLFKSYRDRL